MGAVDFELRMPNGEYGDELDPADNIRWAARQAAELSPRAAEVPRAHLTLVASSISAVTKAGGEVNPVPEFDDGA